VPGLGLLRASSEVRMYVGLYVAANRANEQFRDQFAEDDHHHRDGAGFFAWLSIVLKRLFLPAGKR